MAQPHSSMRHVPSFFFWLKSGGRHLIVSNRGAYNKLRHLLLKTNHREPLRSRGHQSSSHHLLVILMATSSYNDDAVTASIGDIDIKRCG
jgi:hypothetical protein